LAPSLLKLSSNGHGRRSDGFRVEDLARRRPERLEMALNTRNNHERQRGFTFIEIMIVVAIIAMLAVIAIPSFVRARQTSAKSACLNNLREIDGAKQQWALENNKVNTDAPLNSDLISYLKGNAIPDCPGGGQYTIGDVGTEPICNIAGHSF
jgi:prepilin-type N-terminal cleavage/methylation domain-containing protein